MDRWIGLDDAHPAEPPPEDGETLMDLLRVMGLPQIDRMPGFPAQHHS